MVSPVRPFKCPFMSVVKQGGKHQFPNLMRTCCWDRDRSGTKLIFSWFLSEKWHFCVRMFRRYVSVKNGSNVYLVDDEVKELVIICDHVHFSHKIEWTQDCFLSPKGAGQWRKIMWHWYRKWTDSETSRSLILSVSGATLACSVHIVKREKRISYQHL